MLALVWPAQRRQPHASGVVDRSAAAAGTQSSAAKDYNPDGHLPGPGPELPEPASTAAAPASARS